jgi:phenylpyruvate tautomerase PptA (4-oxalocrotonate tautomerase family)
MLDAYIPEDALSAAAERELVATITDLFLEHEGVDPANERGRKLAWVFIHRPAVYVGGEPPRSPRYRFICQVPEGQYDDARRNAVTAGITQAVATAEAGTWPHPELRVCVFTLEVPDGAWGGAGRIIRLPDIYEFIWPLDGETDGDPRLAAEQVLADRRRQQAKLVLSAADDLIASASLKITTACSERVREAHWLGAAVRWPSA